MRSRVELATATYARALEGARERNDATSWRRLVRAAWNLREARTDQARALAAAAPPILLVGDDPDVREALHELLTALGHRVVAAANGRAALELLRDGRLRPAAIVLDLDLPEMSGWDLREELLRDRQLGRIPVIVLSGCDAARVPAATRLPKPVNPDALVNAIRNAARLLGA